MPLPVLTNRIIGGHERKPRYLLIRETQARQVRRDRREIRETQARQDHRDLKGMRELQARQGHRDRREIRETQARQDHRDRREIRETQVRQDLRDRQEVLTADCLVSVLLSLRHIMRRVIRGIWHRAQPLPAHHCLHVAFRMVLPWLLPVMWGRPVYRARGVHVVRCYGHHLRVSDRQDYFSAYHRGGHGG